MASTPGLISSWNELAMSYSIRVCDFGHRCSFFDGDPGPDIQLVVGASEVSDVSEVSQQPVEQRLISLRVNAADVGQGQDQPNNLFKYAKHGLSASSTLCKKTVFLFVKVSHAGSVRGV